MPCFVSSGHQLNRNDVCVHCGEPFAPKPIVIDQVFVTADCSGARCSIDGQPVDEAGTCNAGHLHGVQYAIPQPLR